MEDNYMEPTSPSPDHNEDKEPQEGFTFNWFNLLLGVAFYFWWFQGSNELSDNLTFYLYLGVVVVIPRDAEGAGGRHRWCRRLIYWLFRCQHIVWQVGA